MALAARLELRQGQSLVMTPQLQQAIKLLQLSNLELDVFVEGERVTLIGESLDVAADRVIDATGKYVLPGAIDPHTHLDMPFGGTLTADDFQSGQISAAFGGTTTHIDFANHSRGQ